MTKDGGTRTPQTGTSKDKFISGLKFASIRINSIRGKKLELLAFLDFHQPRIVAIQETKIDSTISTSELFLESGPYIVYRTDRTLDRGGVMLLIQRIFRICPSQNWKITRSQFGYKCKTSQFVASWYRPPGGDLVELALQLKSFEPDERHPRVLKELATE